LAAFHARENTLRGICRGGRSLDPGQVPRLLVDQQKVGKGTAYINS
jgi:hypothetical protein